MKAIIYRKYAGNILVHMEKNVNDYNWILKQRISNEASQAQANFEGPVLVRFGILCASPH